MEPQNSKNKVWTVLAVVVVLAVLGFWFWKGSEPVTAPVEEVGSLVSPEDTVATIDQELQATYLGDLDKEFQDVEVDLNSL